MWNSPKVGEWIEVRTGRVVSQKKQRGLEYLKRLKQSPKVPRAHHKKANNSEQEAFKKTPDEGGQAQGDLSEGEGRAVWCEDEHRLGLKPIIRKVWSPIAQRPLVKVHQIYEWTYLYAFARPKSGEVHWLILPTVSAEVFTLALENFAREVGAGKRKRILLVVDQAGWHTAKKKLKVQEGIHLEFLPSHSPELQPSERLWPLSNEGVANATLRRLRSWRRHSWSVALHCVTSLRSYAPTPATTGGQRRRENQGYSSGLGISADCRL
jgi:transposase